MLLISGLFLLALVLGAAGLSSHRKDAAA